MTVQPTDSRAGDAQDEGTEQPRELNRLDVLRGLRISVWEAGYSTVWSALTTGPFLAGYALWLHANSVQMGLVTAIPIFAGLIQVVASYLGDRLARRQQFVAWLAVTGRLMFLPILLLPLILPGGKALIPFLVLFAISYLLLNASTPAWTSWMADLVPPDHRGRYFASRNRLAGVVAMLIALPAAWFLDFATHRHHWEARGFGTLFGVGVVGGLLSFAALRRQPEPRRAAKPADALPGGLSGAIAYYRAPFADRNFRRLILFNTIFGLGQNFAAPFFVVYALENLHLNYVWLQVFATMTSLCGLGSMALWGYLADKFGNKPLLVLGVMGVVTIPLLWTITTASNHSLMLTLLAVNYMMSGCFWAGVSLTQFNLLIGLSPSAKTPVYVATMAAVTGLTGGIAPLLGGATMHALQGWHTHVLGLDFQNFHLTFVIASSLRLFSLLFLRPVVDAGAIPAHTVLHELSRANPRSWRHIIRLQRPTSEEGRLRATGALAGSRSRIAASELESALHDPSLAVREEAARSLGEIGDPGSVQALLDVLGDPASGLVDEAARALGRIGDRRANASLIALLNTDERFAPTDRAAAVRALGELGGADAVHALIDVLARIRPGSDEETAEAAVRSIGQIGDRVALPILLQRFETADTPRTLRLAIIRSLGELGDRKASPYLRTALQTLGKDLAALPILGDALARLGDSQSILPLLERLDELESAVARKQVAHAIGCLLGAGESLYALLTVDEYGRAAGEARVFSEMDRRTKGLTAPLATVRDAWMEGRMLDAFQTMALIAHQDPAEDEQNAPAIHVLDHLTHHNGESIAPETTLIALLALRVLLTGPDP